ncbi:hypothetical protein FOZ60_010860 [Perkinsus olseni]|uniref:Bromo domain-containing protein n=1 Tax=Perkinsus olseni TaxID=32597 RepID=A0A7J6PBT0_PEROL|nr:hypothetical protein FOZ60_010860 [Perkinsus olseni]
MVLIIDGEIVPDSDPRAAARKRQQHPQNTNGGDNFRSSAEWSSSTPGGPTDHTSNTSGSSAYQYSSSNPQGGGGGAQPGVRAQAERLLGIEGRIVTIPAMLGRPSLDVPLLYIILLALLALMMGPRALVLAALLWFMATGNPAIGGAPVALVLWSLMRAAFRTEDQVLAATKITQSIVAGLFEVIESLRGSPDAEDFKEPVKWKELGLHDYPKMIKRPRDLGTVEARLLLTVKSKKFKKHPQAATAKECGRYTSVLEFFNDLEQIWQNCLTFNDVSSDIAHSAMRMRATCRTRKDTWIHKMVPELVKDGSSPTSVVTPSTSSEKEEVENEDKPSGAKKKGSKAKKDGVDEKRRKKSKTTGTGKSKRAQDSGNDLFSEVNEGDGRNKKKKLKVATGSPSSAEGAATNSEPADAGRDWTAPPSADDVQRLGRRISKLHDHHLAEVVKFMSLTGVGEAIQTGERKASDAAGGPLDKDESLLLQPGTLPPHLFWALNTMVSAQLSRQARSKALRLSREGDGTSTGVS